MTFDSPSSEVVAAPLARPQSRLPSSSTRTGGIPNGPDCPTRYPATPARVGPTTIRWYDNEWPASWRCKSCPLEPGTRPGQSGGGTTTGSGGVAGQAVWQRSGPDGRRDLRGRSRLGAKALLNGPESPLDGMLAEVIVSVPAGSSPGHR